VAAGFTRFSVFAMLPFNGRTETTGKAVMASPSVLTALDRENTASVIDEDHLPRMTLGDDILEREVLGIFAQQATLILARMAVLDHAGIAAAAHTLQGSASGLGAWRLAEAAERVDQAAAGGGDFGAAVAAFEAAATELCATIEVRLNKHCNE
jgi:HPt (histidine-containing phosphotransfer) domain-containing protein